MWLGPAPQREFNPNHFHYRWHWQWEYGTGELGNNGVHGLDLARWGLGVDLPTSVVSSGGKHFFDDDQVTPDTQTVCYEYPGLTLVWEHRTWSPFGMNDSTFGVEFHGDEGIVTTNGREWWIHRAKQPKEQGTTAELSYELEHQRNWLDAIKGQRATDRRYRSGGHQRRPLPPGQHLAKRRPQAHLGRQSVSPSRWQIQTPTR